MVEVHLLDPIMELAEKADGQPLCDFCLGESRRICRSGQECYATSPPHGLMLPPNIETLMIIQGAAEPFANNSITPYNAYIAYVDLHNWIFIHGLNILLRKGWNRQYFASCSNMYNATKFHSFAGCYGGDS